MIAFIKKHKNILTLLPVLTIMAVIFCFSAQNAPKSDHTSSVFVTTFLKLFIWNYDSMDPGRQEAVQSIVNFVVRKGAHLTLYTLLGFSLYLHLSCLAADRKISRPAPLSLGIGALYACSDELHQTFVSGRSGEPADVFLDSAGVLLGIGLLWLILRICKKKQP